MLLNGEVYAHQRICGARRSPNSLCHRNFSAVLRALAGRTNEGGSSGHFMGPHTFGHTGYTGTSIWINPDRQVICRAPNESSHPTRENQNSRKSVRRSTTQSCISRPSNARNITQIAFVFARRRYGEKLSQPVVAAWRILSGLRVAPIVFIRRGRRILFSLRSKPQIAVDDKYLPLIRLEQPRRNYVDPEKASGSR